MVGKRGRRASQARARGVDAAAIARAGLGAALAYRKISRAKRRCRCRRNKPAVKAIGAMSVGSSAVGSLALGAGAVGALAIGALAIRRLAIRRGAIGELDVRELKVGRLAVDELLVREETRPPAAPAPQGL